MCNGTVNIFIKHHMTNFNINLKFHCWDLKVPVVAETPKYMRRVSALDPQMADQRAATFLSDTVGD